MSSVFHGIVVEMASWAGIFPLLNEQNSTQFKHKQISCRSFS